MNDIIQIKCPFCGAVLSVKNQSGIETKNVTCPICKNKSPFTEFRKANSASTGDEPDTEYPDGKEHTCYNEEHTQYRENTEFKNQAANFTLGMLKVIETGASFRLKPGRNIIGRKAQKSEADFKIDTADKRSMSREHIVIEIRKVPAKGYIHYISLFKEKVNNTYIGNEQLFYGDCIVLNHGDLIKLPDATLKFEIPDKEETDF